MMGHVCGPGPGNIRSIKGSLLTKASMTSIALINDYTRHNIQQTDNDDHKEGEVIGHTAKGGGGRLLRSGNNFRKHNLVPKESSPGGGVGQCPCSLQRNPFPIVK